MTVIFIRSPTRQHGFSYIEVLVATVLIIVSLVPALEALQTGIHANQVFNSQSLNHHALVAKIEEVIAKPFDELAPQAAAAGGPTTPTGLSDTPGTSDRRLVYLALYDGDNADADANFFTGGDSDLMWIRVTIENSNHAMETLTSIYD